MKTTFSFGENWTDYVNDALNKERIDGAYNSLLKYLPKEEYKDKIFIDIGCGSGIFSLSACVLGCKEVISFDVDRFSIGATKIVKEKFSQLIPKDSQWNIFEGSILDNAMIENLKEKGDIVYAWGVLHHTGNMYQAIKNASSLVEPNGYLILALYNRRPSSEFWLFMKKAYNKAPMVIKRLMVYSLFCPLFVRELLRRFLKPNTKYHEANRGMSIFYDTIDWLGGYPYEYASFNEIKDYVEKLGFKLTKEVVKLPSLPKGLFDRFTIQYTGNNEFVFKKM